MSNTTDEIVEVEKGFWSRSNDPAYFAANIADDAVTVIEPMGFIEKPMAVESTKGAEPFGPTVEERLAADHESACLQRGEARKGCIEITVGAGIECMEPQSEAVSRRLQFFRCDLGTTGIGRIDEHGKDRHRGDQLMQQFQPLRP